MRISCSFVSPLLALLLAGPASFPALAQDNPAALNSVFDQAFDELAERRPTELSRLGVKKFYDRWDDLSPSEALTLKVSRSQHLSQRSLRIL